MAAAWATLLHFGDEGYGQLARRMYDVHAKVRYASGGQQSRSAFTTRGEARVAASRHKFDRWVEGNRRPDSVHCRVHVGSLQHVRCAVRGIV